MNIKTTYKNESKKLHKKTRSFKKTKLKQYGGRAFIATDFLPIEINNPNGCWLEAAIQMLWCIDPVREYCRSLTVETAQNNMLLSEDEDGVFLMNGIQLFKDDTLDLASYNHDYRVNGINFSQGCDRQNMFLALGAIFNAYSHDVADTKLELVDLQNITCRYIDRFEGKTASKESKCVELIRNTLHLMKMQAFQQHDSEEFLLILLNGLSYFNASIKVFKEITTVIPSKKRVIKYDTDALKHLTIFTDIHFDKGQFDTSKKDNLLNKISWIKKSLHRLLLSNSENFDSIIKQILANDNLYNKPSGNNESDIIKNAVRSFITLAKAKLAELKTINPNLEAFKKYILNIAYIVATTPDGADPPHILHKASINFTEFVKTNKINYINDTSLEEIKRLIALGILSSITLKETDALNAKYRDYIDTVAQYIIENDIATDTDIDNESVDMFMNELLKLYIVYNEANNIKEFFLSSQKEGQTNTEYDIMFDPIFRVGEADKLKAGKISEKIEQYKNLKCFNENKFIMLRINRTTVDEDTSVDKSTRVDKDQSKVTPDTIITFNSNNYRLRGCILHEGTGAQGGHYVFIVYNDQGKASLILNGSTKEELPSLTDTSKYIEENGYVYLYEKIDSDDATSPVHVKKDKCIAYDINTFISSFSHSGGEISTFDFDTVKTQKVSFHAIYNKTYDMNYSIVNNFPGHAIVNFTTTNCVNGGSLDKEINKTGGPLLECAREKLPLISATGEAPIRCILGRAKTTIGGNMKSCLCIHAVVPDYSKYDSNAKGRFDCDLELCHAYISAIFEAHNHGCTNIAFSVLPQANLGNGENVRELNTVIRIGMYGVREALKYLSEKKFNKIEHVFFYPFRIEESSEIINIFKERSSGSDLTFLHGAHVSPDFSQEYLGIDKLALEMILKNPYDNIEKAYDVLYETTITACKSTPTPPTTIAVDAGALIADAKSLTAEAKSLTDEAETLKNSVDVLKNDTTKAKRDVLNEFATEQERSDAVSSVNVLKDKAATVTTDDRKAGKRENDSSEIGSSEIGSSDDKTSNEKKGSDDRDDPGDSSQDNTGENIVLGVLLCVTLVISTVMLL